MLGPQVLPHLISLELWIHHFYVTTYNLPCEQVMAKIVGKVVVQELINLNLWCPIFVIIVFYDYDQGKKLMCVYISEEN